MEVVYSCTFEPDDGGSTSLFEIYSDGTFLLRVYNDEIGCIDIGEDYSNLFSFLTDAVNSIYQVREALVLGKNLSVLFQDILQPNPPKGAINA